LLMAGRPVPLGDGGPLLQRVSKPEHISTTPTSTRTNKYESPREIERVFGFAVESSSEEEGAEGEKHELQEDASAQQATTNAQLQLRPPQALSAHERELLGEAAGKWSASAHSELALAVTRDDDEEEEAPWPTVRLSPKEAQRAMGILFG